VNVATRLGVFAASILGIFCANGAQADDGTWEVRLRALRLAMAQKSDAIPALAVPGDAIHVNDKWIPDIDFEHFFTPHFSSELVLTYPQKQTVTVEKSALGGPTAIGTFKHLPPTLTAKYNLLPGATFRPYVGAGVNITYISSVDLNVPTVGRLDLDHWRVGPAVQAGFDYKVADGWFVNADAKWAMLRSDVKFQGTKISEARLDPFLLSVGLGYRF
jgi:outer membrane protein